MDEKLIIIGNGFDLKAELDSKFASFLDSRLNSKHKRILNTFRNNYSSRVKKIAFNNEEAQTIGTTTFDLSDLGDTLTFKQLAFWDILFYISKKIDNPNWSDIEATIRDFLSGQSIGEFNATTCFHLRQTSSESCLVNSIFLTLFPEDRWKKHNNFYSFLFAELKLLELQFVSYLENQIKQNTSYSLNCETQIKRLLTENDIDFSTTQVSVLNFNYTECLPPNVVLPTNLGVDTLTVQVKSENIHGSLSKKDIIFGIDPKGIDVSNPIYNFSKTYRQLTDSSNLKHRISLLNKEAQKEIIFYGHSLSSLDYSYFQAIFDYFSIYNSSTILRFYFTPHSGKSSDESSREEVAKVLHLLKTYADTLDNKNHGGNLISKLLIENRLHVDEISF